MEQTQNGTPLQELRSRGLTSVGTKLLGPTSTMENIVEKKRVAAIREGIPEEIWNAAPLVWESGKNENK